MTALLESLTALLEYLDLLQYLKITVLGHVHLSACNINNSPHKLGFQFSMRAGDQKLRFDLVWPNSVYCTVLLHGVAVLSAVANHDAVR